VEVEGELRYREYTPTESDRRVRAAEIYATSILALDRSAGQSGSGFTDSDPADEPVEDQHRRASDLCIGARFFVMQR
jgi:single-strand DNA-binding protein